ncbi:hypothetical protein GAMM_170060 [Gammaproteobacteria bacterium]
MRSTLTALGLGWAKRYLRLRRVDFTLIFSRYNRLLSKL